ncbi:MAG: stage 0 sporulation family protein, partial [Dehalococcoidia bacterium]|nr:stage 0 sporulation family protein [Dehalococcoidia bacterium]
MADQQRVPVGVRFKEAGKVYYFDAGGLELDVGTYVVVGTSHGQEVGRVVISPEQVIASEIKESLKPILRRAEPEDLEKAEELKKGAQEKLATARKEADEQGLDMRVVAGDYSLDASQLTFYFTAEDRIDFRSLARSLSSRFDTRIQFLQIGDRDRAKIVDGIGRCGERLCCSSWLGTFPTVSIKMAKEQDLPLNPSKLSGACGRLLCCLTYEYDQYRDIKGGLPKVGAKISTPTGEAKVLKINVPKETISLAVGEAREHVEMPLNQFRLMYGTALRPKELTETF